MGGTIFFHALLRRRKVVLHHSRDLATKPRVSVQAIIYYFTPELCALAEKVTTAFRILPSSSLPADGGHTGERPRCKFQFNESPRAFYFTVELCVPAENRTSNITLLIIPPLCPPSAGSGLAVNFVLQYEDEYSNDDTQGAKRDEDADSTNGYSAGRRRTTSYVEPIVWDEILNQSLQNETNLRTVLKSLRLASCLSDCSGEKPCGI